MARQGKSGTYIEACEECSKTFMTYKRGRGMYCSPACKQRAYRRRKKQADKSKALTRSMDVYMSVDNIMSEIHDTCTDSFNNRLWSLLDTISTEKAKHETLDIIYRAIANSKYRIEKLSE